MEEKKDAQEIKTVEQETHQASGLRGTGGGSPEPKPDPQRIDKTPPVKMAKGGGGPEPKPDPIRTSKKVPERI